jgi:hypothetical protein
MENHSSRRVLTAKRMMKLRESLPYKEHMWTGERRKPTRFGLVNIEEEK